MNNKKKVGILTLPLDYNYGGVLQAYALYTTLNNSGYEAHLINRRWDNNRKDIIYKTKKLIYKNFVMKNFTKFIKNNFNNITSEITSQEDMKEVDNLNFDAIIVGSDQVWRLEHTNGVKNNYFLDFIENKNTKKISYAASFGKDKIECNTDRKKIITKLLSEFDAVSVREDSGVSICKKEFNCDATQVLDPTLLLSKEEYLKLLPIDKKSIQKNILTTYILDKSNENQNIIDKVAKYKSLNNNPINHAIDSFNIKGLLLNINKINLHKISNWIKGIDDAEFIITDSFHGVVFSIIFNKQFICIGNKGRGLARFTSLLKIFGLEDRMVFSIDDITDELLNKNIDFKMVNDILAKKQKESLQFIKNNI